MYVIIIPYATALVNSFCYFQMNHIILPPPKGGEDVALNPHRISEI